MGVTLISDAENDQQLIISDTPVAPVAEETKLIKLELAGENNSVTVSFAPNGIVAQNGIYASVKGASAPGYVVYYK